MLLEPTACYHQNGGCMPYDRREQLRQEYVRRINRVLDYVREDLVGDLRLETLARVANFSPFHFHRIFHGMTGETLNTFIRRVRVETAAAKLLHSPKLSITRVAVDCGYSSPSSFAREFRDAFGMSASQFRDGGFASQRKIRQEDRKIGEDESALSSYDEDTIQQLRRRYAMVEMKVDVKEMPEMHVAYIRHIGPYNQIGGAFGKLMQWAGPRGLLNFPETKMLGVYHDDPGITEESKLQSSACITVPEDTKVEGEVGTMSIPGGLFVVGHVEINQDQFGEAWDKLMGEWLPESGYQPDDRPCYELYLNDPKQHPEGKFIVDICEPVKPM